MHKNEIETAEPINISFYKMIIFANMVTKKRSGQKHDIDLYKI